LSFLIAGLDAFSSPKKLPIPVAISENSDGTTTYATYRDIDQMKIMFFGYMAGILAWVAKSAYEMWQKRNDRSQDILEDLVKSVHTLSTKVDKIEKEMISRHEVHSFVRQEMEYVDRIKSK